MLSQERHSSRSPSESVQTDSVRTGPTSRLVSRQSHRSSITEEDDNDNIPPAPPLPTFGTSAKSSSSSSSSTPSQSTPKPTTGGTNAAKIINAIAFQRPPARRESSGEQNSSAQRNSNKKTTTPSESKGILQGLFGRVSARDLENEKPISTYPLQSRKGNPNQSIFEKVDTHGGSTTYLGSGTFPQLENCIRNCLSHNQSHTDFTNHNTKYGHPHKSLTHASVLEDYSYDGILSSNHHMTRSTSDHHHFSDHKKHAAELSLDEIRQVNDALAKYNIPIFSHHEHPYNAYNKPRSVGDIISACELLMADPLLRAQREGPHAVQHVWDNLHLHSPHTNIHGYASPAMQGVASHLFNPTHQTPYDPVHGVASHLFSHPQQSPYNPGQGPVPNLFSHPQQSPYNPGQSAVSNLFGNPQQSSYNPGQSAISRLFSGPQQQPPPPPPQQQQQHFQASPFSASFNQYPGNNPYTH